MTRLTSYAPDIFRALKGIACIYKPALLSGSKTIDIIQDLLAEELNQYEPRPLAKRLVYSQVQGQDTFTEGPNWADHPLVVGPRYLPWEIKMSIPCNLNRGPAGMPPKVSGVACLLIGRKIVQNYTVSILQSKFISIYHIKVLFGYSTSTFFSDGSITDRSNYKHIYKHNIESILQRIKVSQKQRIFEASNVPRSSDEAYELAKAWPRLRPKRMARWPIIFDLKCLEFKAPYMTLEITSSEETVDFLGHFVHDLAELLKSKACVESIRRIKYGPFELDNALCDRDWNLQAFVNSINYHNKYLQRYGDG